MWSAGDEKHPLEPGGGWALTDTAEIYSPPYLFKGPRPTIVSAPSQLRWGDVFRCALDPSVPAESAVLVAPGATTHASDYHPASWSRSRCSAPTRAASSSPRRRSDAVAPPGYYMLFVLHQGVPSVA